MAMEYRTEKDYKDDDVHIFSDRGNQFNNRLTVSKIADGGINIELSGEVGSRCMSTYLGKSEFDKLKEALSSI